MPEVLELQRLNEDLHHCQNHAVLPVRTSFEDEVDSLQAASRINCAAENDANLAKLSGWSPLLRAIPKQGPERAGCRNSRGGLSHDGFSHHLRASSFSEQIFSMTSMKMLGSKAQPPFTRSSARLIHNRKSLSRLSAPA